MTLRQGGGGRGSVHQHPRAVLGDVGRGFVLMIGSDPAMPPARSARPKGQTTLAAGNDFVLRRGFNTDGNATSTTQGIEIATGTWNACTRTPGGAVTNGGQIFGQQGDIMLDGRMPA